MANEGLSSRSEKDLLRSLGALQGQPVINARGVHRGQCNRVVTAQQTPPRLEPACSSAVQGGAGHADSELMGMVGSERTEGAVRSWLVSASEFYFSPLQTSVIFDIKLRGEFDGTVTFHHPVLPARSIQPYQIPMAGKGTST